LSAFRW